jgi:hypothetical protein
MKNIEFDAIVESIQRVNLKPAIREGLDKLLSDLQGIRGDYKKDLDAVKSDQRLSKIGKAQKHQEIFSEYKEHLENFADPYRKNLDFVKRRLLNGNGQEKKSDLAKVVDYLRQSEIRRMCGVESMDELEIEAQSHDPMFLEAVLSSPKPLLPPEKIDRLVMKKAENDNPELGVEFEQLTFAAKTVGSFIKAFNGDIEASGWKDPEDPLNAEPVASEDALKDLAEGQE